MELQFIPISAESSAPLEPYRNIRERDLRGRQDLFIAEGKTVLAVLLQSARFSADSLLIAERKLPGLLPLLQRARPQCPVYIAPQNIMDNIAGFAVHRGILAVGRRRAAPNMAEFLAGLPQQALIVALSGISNHDNIGSVFRNAAAFAADGVALDSACCDPLYRKSIRVSVGAALRVPYAQSGGAEGSEGKGSSEGSGAAGLCAALRAANFRIWAMSGDGEAELAQAAAAHQQALAQGRAGRLALLFGSEGEGLPAEILAPGSPLYVPSLRIPIAPDFDSLNIATACGITLAAFANPARLR